MTGHVIFFSHFGWRSCLFSSFTRGESYNFPSRQNRVLVDANQSVSITSSKKNTKFLSACLFLLVTPWGGGGLSPSDFFSLYSLKSRKIMVLTRSG